MSIITNPLMFLKGAKIFVIVAVIAFALSTLKTCENNRVAERDAAIIANAAKVTAQANAANLTIANDQLVAVTKAQAQALIAAAQARVETDAAFTEIRKTQQEQKTLLEGNRLNDAIKSKKSLVELRLNRATRERFDEVEDIFNGT